MIRFCLSVLMTLAALSPLLCHAFVGAPPYSRERWNMMKQEGGTDVVKRALVKSDTSGEENDTLKKSLRNKSTRSTRQELDYEWKEQWYALTYADYVPNPSRSAETVPAAVFGNPLVLWRSEDNGIIHCADDSCPHRRAALTEGRVRNGKLECYYHGWQFQGSANVTDSTLAGGCTFVPQLATGARIPKAACLNMRDCRIVEGIVWVWMGDDVPNKDVPKQGDGLDPRTGAKDGFILNNFQIDLPYDHSYLVENLLDPAHISISHDRTEGGGKRENAEAYEMLIDKESIGPEGFTGRYRLESRQKKGDPFIEVKYEAPGIIRQTGSLKPGSRPLQFGAALHCMPLSLGRSRLLFRTYVGGLPPILKFLFELKPTFLRSLNSCKVLEQDAGLITTQEDYFKRQPNRYLKDDFILLQSMDGFVKTYRQWLDQVGHGMPWFQGLATRSENVDDHLKGFVNPPALDPMFHRAGNFLETRYHRHVVHCPNTRKALARIQQLKRIMVGFAVAATTFSCTVAPLVGSGPPAVAPKVMTALRRALFLAVPIIPLSSITAAMLHRLEQRFFVSFKRKEQMRTERGD